MNVAVDSLGPGGAGGHLARRLIGFLHLLRDNGLHVGLRESRDAFHFSNTAAVVERSGHFGSHVLTFDGRLVRNDLAVTLAGEMRFGPP